jgi:hypothetical protein
MSERPDAIRTARYALELSEDGLRATLTSPAGEPWLILRPLAALDTTDGPDETVAVSPPRLLEPGVIEVERRSTRWARAWTRLICTPESVEIETRIEGTGRLATGRLLAVRSLLPGHAHGLLPSGSLLPDLFSPNPDRPQGPTRPLAHGARIGVVGDDEPGRGRWLFTPAPLYLRIGEIGVSVLAPVTELRVAELVLEGWEGAFDLALPYAGHAEVQGAFSAPSVLITPGDADPYDGIRRHRALVASRALCPAAHPRATPGWWSEPMFCGWGAQCARAVQSGRPAATHATQAEYDADLALLEGNGVVPGTVVIDDKWQSTYGANEVDPVKWPDLEGWIARRHDRGQRVLLWLKAWDPEGLADELCLRAPEGGVLGLDPGHPETIAHVERMLARLLGAGGLNADGLKIDFTARTPSGWAVASHSGAWGIALLHELLALIHRAAKRTDPDALLITQAAHPAFADVGDMIRLNDILAPAPGQDAGACVEEQMRHRAAVAGAACPQLLIDTDDWCQPDLASWRNYLRIKPRLGVPSLYYAGALESGEHLQREDYAALRQTWRAWREGRR